MTYIFTLSYISITHSLLYMYPMLYYIYTYTITYIHTLGRFFRVHDPVGAHAHLCHTAGGAE